MLGLASLTVHVVGTCSSPREVFVSIEPIDRPGSSERWFEGTSQTWDALPDGEYIVRAVPSNGSEIASKRVRLERGQDVQLTLSAPDTAPASGLVLEASGAPARTFAWRIDARPAPGDRKAGDHELFLFEGSEHDVESTDGRFCVQADALPRSGMWRIVVNTRDGEFASSEWYDLATTPVIHDLVLVLSPPAQLTGFVTAHGIGISGAEVRVVGATHADRMTRIINGEPQWNGTLLWGPPHEALATATTDKSGSFAVALEGQRSVTVHVSHSGFEPWESGVLHLPESGGMIPLNPQLSRGGSLVGRVLWADLPNRDAWAKVTVSYYADIQSFGEGHLVPASWSTSVDRQGAFQLDGLPGEELMVSFKSTPVLKGLPPLTYSVDVALGQTTELTIDMDALLERPTVEIKLRRPPELADEGMIVIVLNAEGQPIGQHDVVTTMDALLVSDMPEGPFTVRAMIFFEPGLHAFASAPGRIPSGGRAAPVTIDMTASRLELQVDAAYEVDFTVQSAGGDSDADPWTSLVQVSSDESGRCRVFGLPPGVYFVSCLERPGVTRSVALGSQPVVVRFD